MLIVMNKIRHKTIAQLVVEQLREKIICGEIKPGQRINLDEIANEFNISRNPVREALLLLKGEDFITMESNRGAVAKIVDSAHVDELFSVKMLLESDLLADSIVNLSQSKLNEAKDILNKLKETNNVNDWSELSTQYYDCLYSGSERPETQKILNSLRRKTERYSRLYYAKCHGEKAAVNSKVLQYCLERKADRAVAELKSHLLARKNEIRQLLL